jgi:ABC-2 type transport system ATP-binding protein
LLDEPHAGLDVTARDDLDALVREAVAVGATAVVASHELDRSAGLATRTVELVGGMVIGPGAPAPGSGGPPPTRPEPGGTVHVA